MSARASIVRALAVSLLIALLLGARKLSAGSRTKQAAVPSDPGSSWSEDLAEDRLFERSLISREIAAVLLIGLLVVGRQLLS